MDIMHRPRSVAQARRRRGTVYAVAVVTGLLGLTYAVGAALDRPEVCWIDASPDGTWVGVNFNADRGIPEGCDLRVWHDEP